MKKYAILDKDGNVVNTIIYDGVSKYDVKENLLLKEITEEKFKYAEIGDKIISNDLEKVIKPEVVIK